MSTKTSKKFEAEFGNISFGDIFCSHRESEGLTQVDVARLLKISRQNVCDIEKGRWLPSPDLIEKFALKLGYSPVVFLKFYFDEILKKKKMGKYKVEVTNTKAG